MTAPAPLSGGDARTRATVSEDDETDALDLVYAWLGGDRAARTLLLRPEYDTLTANIAQALADQRARYERIADERAAEALEDAAQWLTGTGHGRAAPDVASDGLSWRDCRTPNEASDWFEQSLRDRAASLRAGESA